MIDYLCLGLSHAVLLLAFWRLAQREDLDRESPREELPEQAEPQAQSGARGGPLRRA